MAAGFLYWLDASPARYWSFAWPVFGITVAFAVMVALRRQPSWRIELGFGALAIFCILAFRWPLLLDNRQFADPDESQLIAGALTLSHDPRFWVSVDGTTHGPLAAAPLVIFDLLGGTLDFTTARLIGVLLATVAIASALLIFRHLFGPRLACLLALPLVAASAFPHETSFVQYYSEQPAAALLALGCLLLLTAWTPTGENPRRRMLFAGGFLIGLTPFAKLQSGPISAWAIFAAAIALLRTPGLDGPARWRALGSLVAGTGAAPACILLPVAAGGIWPDFWQSYILNNLQYAGERQFPWFEAPARLLELGTQAEAFNHYFIALIGFATLALPFVHRQHRWHQFITLFAAGLVLASAYAAMAPGRMYMHYLNLMIFPIGLLGGVMAGAVFSALRTGAPGPARPASIMAGALLVFFLVGGLVPQTVFRASESYIPYYLGRLTAARGQLERSEAAREILRHGRPGDRLAIWGWAPMLWVQTGLIQGTRDGNAFRQIAALPDRDYYLARYLADIQRNQPAVFVDSVGGENFLFQNRAADGHETFPELAAYITAHYEFVRDVDGSRIYRKKRPAGSGPEPRRATAESWPPPAPSG